MGSTTVGDAMGQWEGRRGRENTPHLEARPIVPAGPQVEVDVAGQRGSSHAEVFGGGAWLQREVDELPLFHGP